jgi:lipoprotein NlpI
LAELRAGYFDGGHFAQEIAQLRYSDWPYPILLLLQGDRSPESIMRAATRDDDKGRLCEADFYLAEWHLVSRNPETAKPLLQDATNICPRDYVERQAARIELSKLH